MLKIIRSVVNPIGYDIVKYKSTNPAHIVLSLLNMNNIETILDVGANTGQYSIELLKAGYKGRIISFEPLTEAYTKLSIIASHYKNWETYNFALGDTKGTASINISMHSPSSSLLPMTKLHSEAAPDTVYIKEEKIKIETLDNIFETFGISDENVFLKVDTQGYEDKVLKGGIKTLSQIQGIQLELSTSELYEGEGKYYSICQFVEEKNFHMVSVIPGFTHKATREMLQFDAIFFRKTT
jgi:FkbM family methyltransferase